MKKTMIVTIVAVLAVLGVGIIIKFSQNGTTAEKNAGVIQVNNDANNEAAKIGEGEVKVTAENFDTEIKNYKGVAMVDIYLPTCPHCIKMGPIVSEIAKENQGKYKIGKLDANVNSDLATEFKIESVPAFIFFKDGKEVARLVGEKPKEDLLSKLDEISKS